MAKKVRLKNSEAHIYHGIMKYLITYDHMAGRHGRYSVFVLTSADPISIGRELDLPYIRELIHEYEEIATKVQKLNSVHSETPRFVDMCIKERSQLRCLDIINCSDGI